MSESHGHRAAAYAHARSMLCTRIHRDTDTERQRDRETARDPQTDLVAGVDEDDLGEGVALGVWRAPLLVQLVVLFERGRGEQPLARGNGLHKTPDDALDLDRKLHLACALDI
eukprot:821488-Rhodomonas_salina.3